MTRDEAIKELELIAQVTIWNDRREAVEMAIEALQAESVKHGKWILNDNGTYSCSVCHSWLPAEQKEYARYCLYCGAKMDKEGEFYENNITD